MYRFFRFDLDALTEKRDELAGKMREAAKLMGEANEQSSETWHDNAPLDVAHQEFERHKTRHDKLDNIIKNAEIIDPPEEIDGSVTLGTKVHYKDRAGNVKCVKIGSYTPSEASGAISYEAPLAHILMGARVGDLVEGYIAGEEVEYEITEISTFLQPDNEKK